MKLKSSLALLGTLAVTTTALTALAAPAGAASGALAYACKDPLNRDFTFTVEADTNAPAAVKVGQSFTPTVTAKVTVPSALRETLAGLGAATVEGGTNAAGESTSFGFAVDGAAGQLPATVPVTPVPASGDLVVPATAVGTAITPAAVGTVKLTAGNFTAVLAGKTTSGGASTLSPYKVTCTLNPGQDATVDTVAVTADGTVPPTAAQETTTKVKASYAKKAKKIVATVKVGSDDKAATGKAKVLVKLGKKTVKKLTVSVKGGKARAVVKNVTKPGTYKVTVSYAGDDTHEKSKGKATVKVS
ncbi:hypothetical protein EUA93_19380 [Nocardioides oleivorans]|uniref:DUF6801 domain-containing protein n=1 Tax=Nocardioides oleivorans TaxID=273676 RepID=A0A4Q2RQ57_9ACTN|nr:DUF6801 domain-containing protein [Nocardioides oleivorans]RYB91090.1 hypothetical protein EUA93_19380 [Nocardioides oleivorans]